METAIELIQRHRIPEPTFKQIKDFYDKNLHPDFIDLKDAVYEMFSTKATLLAPVH